MPPALLLALIAFVTPYIHAGIAAWQKRNNTTDLPTPEQIRADFKAHGAAILAEGDAWDAEHPATASGARKSAARRKK